MPKQDKPFTISRERAVQKLQQQLALHDREAKHLSAAVNVRSSERAMAMVHHAETKEALSMAIELLEGK
jgi:hypothetical protein